MRQPSLQVQSTVTTQNRDIRFMRAKWLRILHAKSLCACGKNKKPREAEAESSKKAADTVKDIPQVWSKDGEGGGGRERALGKELPQRLGTASKECPCLILSRLREITRKMTERPPNKYSALQLQSAP